MEISPVYLHFRVLPGSYTSHNTFQSYGRTHN